MKRAAVLPLVFFCIVLVRLPQAGAKESGADLVVVNATIITVDRDHSRAQALAVKGDKFIAVGTDAQIRKLVGADTTVVDAEGKTVTPGSSMPISILPRRYPADSRLGKLI
jgi:hypothetical protein